MSAAIVKSAFTADLARYRRSASLWLLLLSAPVAARYMISETEGEGINIAVGGQLPVLTSPVLGIWLGIVVSLLVMPVVFIYLRAGPTRAQPWQVTESSAAPRVAIAMGRFLADAVIALGALSALTAAGLFLGWLKVTGPFEPGVIIALAWLVAGPTLLAIAALRILFDAVPFLRGALGDFVFFMLWFAALIIPSLLSEGPSTFGGNLASLNGAIRPLVESAPPGSDSFAVGTSSLKPGRIELDPWAGIAAQGYIASRVSWVVFAFLIAIAAGLLYAPHKPKARREWFGFLERFSLAKLIPRRAANAAPAGLSPLWAPGLVLAEMRLIGAGRWFVPLAAISAIMAATNDFGRVGSPVILLLMVFALTAHAGRSEARGLLALTGTAVLSPWARRAAFVVAGTVLTAALALPASVATASATPLVTGLVTGACAAAAAMGLAAISGSAFMPRIVLLIAWYVYMAG
ncbi:MAG: hypothetical protein AAF291_16125 [Pseudomonadota bacterium]